jgi:hypothetical protein
MSDPCRFFGRVEVLRKKLTQAIKSRREELNLTPEQLDKLCMLGRDLPTCRQFENNPSLMNSRVFGVASFALGLPVDEILKDDLKKILSDKIVNEFIEEIRREKCLKAGTGGAGVEDVSAEDQVQIYIVLKALKQMDGNTLT